VIKKTKVSHQHNNGYIALNKLSNESFSNFLEMYTGKDVPTEATLRLGSINEIFEETIDKIKFELSGKKIWVSTDETTDIEGRFVANVIGGTLQIDCPGKQYLVR